MALCFTGEFRALDVVYPSVAAHATPAGCGVNTFFYLEAMAADALCLRANRSTGMCRPRAMSVREGSPWSSISDLHAEATASLYCATRWHYRPHQREQLELYTCGANSEQYWKLQRVFMVVKRYEEECMAQGNALTGSFGYVQTPTF